MVPSLLLEVWLFGGSSYSQAVFTEKRLVRCYRKVITNSIVFFGVCDGRVLEVKTTSITGLFCSAPGVEQLRIIHAIKNQTLIYWLNFITSGSLTPEVPVRIREI